MKKTTTAIRLDNHEKLCRIMQKQTHDKINSLKRFAAKNLKRKNAGVQFSRMCYKNS